MRCDICGGSGRLVSVGPDPDEPQAYPCRTFCFSCVHSHLRDALWLWKRDEKGGKCLVASIGRAMTFMEVLRAS